VHSQSKEAFAYHFGRRPQHPSRMIVATTIMIRIRIQENAISCKRGANSPQNLVGKRKQTDHRTLDPTTSDSFAFPSYSRHYALVFKAITARMLHKRT
jgi:hypothetical protein